MFFKKQKEELKQMVETVQVVPLFIAISVSLITGFAVGATVTAGLYQAIK